MTSANPGTTDLLLSRVEIIALTGYQKPILQVRELRARGFSRARTNAMNDVVLERAHYLSVCAGQQAAATEASSRPKVLPPPGRQRLRAA